MYTGAKNKEKNQVQVIIQHCIIIYVPLSHTTGDRFTRAKTFPSDLFIRKWDWL